MFKRVLSLLLGMLMLFSSIPVFAASTDVAELILYSTENDDHSFLVVKNLSSSTIKVGHFDVESKSSVTLGTWGSIKEHKGIWYNLEGYVGIADNVSVSMNLTETQLTTLNSTINKNDSWALLSNCSTFASKVWNSVSSTKVSAGLINTPGNLADSIKSKFADTYESNRTRPSKKSSDLAYQTSTGVTFCPNPTGGGSSSSSRYVEFNQFDNGNATSFNKSDIMILKQLNSINR